MAFKMTSDVAGNIHKPKIHGGSDLFKKSGPPGFFGKLLDPLGLRKKIGGKLCKSKLFNPGGAGGPAAAAQAAGAAAAAPASVDPGAAAGIPAPAAAPVEAAAGPAVMHKKNSLTSKPGAPWNFLTEEEEFRVGKRNKKGGKGSLTASASQDSGDGSDGDGKGDGKGDDKGDDGKGDGDGEGDGKGDGKGDGGDGGGKS